MEREQALFRLFGKFCPEGTILFAENAPGEELYVVQSGAVRLRRPGAEEVRGPGELLGEEAFFGRAPRRWRAEVVQDSRLLLLNDRTLDGVVRHGPEVAAGLCLGLLALADGARDELDSWVLTHRFRRLEPHLRDAGAAGLRVEALAEAAGLSLPATRSALEALEGRGVVARAGEGYRLGDPKVGARAGGGGGGP
jgi:CRP-like cAMP-binding protein